MDWRSYVRSFMRKFLPFLLSPSQLDRYLRIAGKGAIFAREGVFIVARRFGGGDKLYSTGVSPRKSTNGIVLATR